MPAPCWAVAFQLQAALLMVIGLALFPFPSTTFLELNGLLSAKAAWALATGAGAKKKDGDVSGWVEAQILVDLHYLRLNASSFGGISRSLRGHEIASPLLSGF